EYKYLAEIGQMMFVFGEVQDPLPETIKLVEDIVRGQVIEMVTRARLLTHLRASRYLSAEDLIFLIREDRGKVNRLRTYLSWKDVRKRAKEEEEGDVELVDEKALKSRRTMVKLPWELLTPFSDFLKGLPSSQNRAAAEEEDEEDEDEMQAYQDSMQRLRDADEITKKMTKDEYVHYSDCRQASFTYRKAKRFREFINFTAYLDVRPNDDIVDILGFLSFEMVRSLCVTALDVRDRHNNSHSVPAPSPAPRGMKRRHTGESIPKRGGGATGNGGSHYPLSLFAPPPSARQPLLPAHVLEAFAQIQRQQANIRGSGLRHWRGGVGRSRMALV
ncbi:transcription initiation factor IID, 18kD subunit-domain-containing protein, partial [Naematelia encephala]